LLENDKREGGVGRREWKIVCRKEDRRGGERIVVQRSKYDYFDTSLIYPLYLVVIILTSPA
jgi:hypothetical protein